MSLLSLQNATFDYGRERVVADANLSIFAGIKYALVGDNGAGKTTLLALLAGELPLHGGERQVAGRARIGWLRQETTLNPTDAAQSLYASVAEAAFASELEIESELSAVAAALADAPREAIDGLAKRQGHLLAEYERLRVYSLRSRLEAALLGLGLPVHTWHRPVGELSGGERRRAMLAAVLLAEDDLLLLDEPTNHLDLAACEWLEGHLSRLPVAAILVSHDRYFLDRVATQTLHLERGRLTTYSGNYSFFHDAWQQQRRQAQTAYIRQQERIRRTEDFIRRNLAGQKTKQAQSRRKLLAREERLARPVAVRERYTLNLMPARTSGENVLEVGGLAKGYEGRELFNGLDMLVARGERIGVVGPNGCGKSTLLRLLAGHEMPDRGFVRCGHNVDLGSYDQHLRGVRDDRTVLGEMAAVDPASTEGELRTFLGAFGFGADWIDRPVGALSGGERARLALLRLLKEGHNTLLMDEPTNHLDIRSREALEEALAGFDGTLVVVSHDRRFLDQLVGRLIVFAPPDTSDPPDSLGAPRAAQPRAASRLEVHLGNYAAYVERRDALAKAAVAQGVQPDPRRAGGATAADGETPARMVDDAGRALSKNELARRRLWIAEAEQAIARLETERVGLLAGLASPDRDHGRLRQLSARLADIERELAEKMTMWEKWSHELETETAAAGDQQE